MKKQPNILDRLLQNRLLSHALFWLALLTINNVMDSVNQGNPWASCINSVVLLPIQLVAAYYLVYHQVPNLLMKKKYGHFLGSMFISVFVLTFLARMAIIYIAEPLYRTNFLQESFMEVLLDPGYLLLVYFPTVYLYALILEGVKAVKIRFEEKHQLELLKKEKLTTELKFLKAQIHPHFLFNTLNNLYTLSLEKSDKAPELIIKLSEILDFILYQCSAPRVPIKKEVDLIQNYIDLELLRYNKKLDLLFKKDIDNEDTPIAPLLLFSIIENAFKHGVNGNIINPKVHVNLTVKKNNITFIVHNNKTQGLKVEPNKKGVGNSNVTRQLDLIYPDKYNLDVEDRAVDYKLKLKIDGNYLSLQK